MTLEDAFTVLGVDAAATEDEVRRAYLRLVKKHRPESDPTGFQRVREAYDLAREWRPFPAAQIMTPADALVVPLPDAGTRDTASDRDGPGVQLFRQRADELAEADAAGAIALWRSAVRAHPDSSEARWALIEAYFQAGNPKRAGRALLRAYRRGLPDFAAALLTRAPGHAPAELYEQAMQDPALAFAAATGLVETGDPSAALPYLEARLTAEPGNHGSGFMLVSLVTRALSRLGEQGELAGFERLARRFSEYSKHEDVPIWGCHRSRPSRKSDASGAYSGSSTQRMSSSASASTSYVS